MASAEFDDDSAEKRPTVQVGDPFAEKLLLEACLEIMESRLRDRDPGHGRGSGLTCSAVEMGAKGDLGVDLDLDAVPTRETGMSAYEMMLSESQERMLMVLKPEKEKEAEAIFRKWGLDFAVVGYTTPSKRFVVKHGGDVMADLPIKELGDEAPLYDRPHVASPPLPVIHARDVAAPMTVSAALEELIATPELCSKRWVWEQYDHVILGNTVQRPGGDAAVVPGAGGAEGAGADGRREPRVIARPIRIRAACRRWRRPGATSPPSAAGRSPSPTISIRQSGTSRNHGPVRRLPEGHLGSLRALDFPSCPATSRSTTRPNGRGILPTPLDRRRRPARRFYQIRGRWPSSRRVRRSF